MRIPKLRYSYQEISLSKVHWKSFPIMYYSNEGLWVKGASIINWVIRQVLSLINQVYSTCLLPFNPLLTMACSIRWSIEPWPAPEALKWKTKIKIVTFKRFKHWYLLVKLSRKLVSSFAKTFETLIVMMISSWLSNGYNQFYPVSTEKEIGA